MKPILNTEDIRKLKTDDGLNRSNVVIVGKKQLLKVALALIVMALFNKNTTINKFKTN